MIGSIIDDRYELNSELGEGGMAKVYRATDLRLNRDVAVKILHSHIAQHEDLRLRFEREAGIAAQLIHPNIVQIYDYGISKDGSTYIVSELVKGKDLHYLQTQRRKKQGKPFPIVFSLMVCEEILKALSIAHRMNFVHRDVKPDNIMISDDGMVKLTDFGIAKNIDSSMTVIGNFLGSPVYASPEQVQGQSIDSRSDLFAVGVILYESLTGVLPFSGNTASEVMMKISKGEFLGAKQVFDEIPNEIDAVIRKALANDKNERFSSAEEMSKALRTFLESLKIEDSRSGLELYARSPDDFMHKYHIQNAAVRNTSISHDTPSKEQFVRTKNAKNRKGATPFAIKNTLKFANIIPHRSQALIARARKSARTIRSAPIAGQETRGAVAWAAFAILVIFLLFSAFTLSDKIPLKKQTLSRISPTAAPSVTAAPNLPPLTLSKPETRAPKANTETIAPTPSNPTSINPKRTAQTLKSPVPGKKISEPRLALNATTKQIFPSPQSAQIADISSAENKFSQTALGKVSIQTAPGNAPVLLDGKQITQTTSDGTPKIFEVKPGPHTISVLPIEIRGLRYAGFERRIYVEALKTNSLGTIRLTPIRSLTLNFSGPGVMVKVNNVSYSATGRPLVLNLPEGRIDIKAKSINGKTYERSLTLKGENLTLKASLE